MAMPSSPSGPLGQGCAMTGAPGTSVALMSRVDSTPTVTPMLISLIAAVAQNGTIGRKNQLPWRIADDMRFFTATTHGHIVISGRKNFDAMGGPLPHRPTFVVTRDPTYVALGARVFLTLEQALLAAEARRETEAFVIGGAELYHLAKPYAHRYYRTTVLAEVDGDVRFDDSNWEDWSVTLLEECPASPVNEYPFRIELLSRRSAPRPVHRDVAVQG